MHGNRANNAGRSVRKPTGRRGGVLFEVVLSIALFGGAASFTLASVRSVFTTLDHTRRRQEAVDLARSKLAELEAGLINLADLRGDATAVFGSSEFTDGDAIEHLADRGRWVFEVRTSRTEFTDLSLVELTVREDVSEAENPLIVTLRQLMPLREADPEAYEPDQLIQGLEDD